MCGALLGLRAVPDGAEGAGGGGGEVCAGGTVLVEGSASALFDASFLTERFVEGRREAGGVGVGFAGGSCV